MSEFTSQSVDQATVVKTTAMFVAMVAVFATMVRAIVAQEVDNFAVPPTLLSAALMLIVNRYVHHGGSPKVGGWSILFVLCCIYGYLSIMSHGFRGSMIYAAPVLPLLTWVLLDRAATRVMTVLVGVFIMFIMSQHLSGELVASEDFPEEIRYVMKSVVMVLSLIAVYWVISFKSVEQKSVAVLRKPNKESQDELTGLLSRTAMDEALRKELIRAHRSAQSLSLVVASVDGFSQLVEEIGPTAVDKTLVGAAEALQYCMRRSSDSLGRYAYSRFAILMPDTSKVGAAKVAEKFRELMETLDIPFKDGETIRLAVTVAACSLRADGEAHDVGSVRQFEAFHENVDVALEEGHEAGGNRVIVREVT